MCYQESGIPKPPVEALEYPLSERVFRITANCTARILIEHFRHSPMNPYMHPLLMQTFLNYRLDMNDNHAQMQPLKSDIRYGKRPQLALVAQTKMEVLGF